MHTLEQFFAEHSVAQ